MSSLKPFIIRAMHCSLSPDLFETYGLSMGILQPAQLSGPCIDKETSPTFKPLGSSAFPFVPEEMGWPGDLSPSWGR